MKRREFLTLAGVGAMGAPTFYQDSVWRPDGAGSLARIGVLTPDFDPVPESEMWTMSPDGVSVHAARVTRTTRDARAFAEASNVDAATEALSRLSPRVILYAYTSSSYALGAAADEPLRARLEKRAGGIPVFLTCMAAAEALRIVGAKRLALIHPPWFTEEVSAQGASYFGSLGFDVLACTHMTPARDFTEVPPAEVYEWTRAHVPPQVDAAFVGGNGLRAVGTIEALEETLRRPVLTANQVLFWKALQLVGLSSEVMGYGKLFTLKTN